jgi:hypothetical protein
MKPHPAGEHHKLPLDSGPQIEALGPTTTTAATTSIDNLILADVYFGRGPTSLHREKIKRHHRPTPLAPKTASRVTS